MPPRKTTAQLTAMRGVYGEVWSGYVDEVLSELSARTGAKHVKDNLEALAWVRAAAHLTAFWMSGRPASGPGAGRADEMDINATAVQAVLAFAYLELGQIETLEALDMHLKTRSGPTRQARLDGLRQSRIDTSQWRVLAERARFLARNGSTTTEDAFQRRFEALFPAAPFLAVRRQNWWSPNGWPKSHAGIARPRAVLEAYLCDAYEDVKMRGPSHSVLKDFPWPPADDGGASTEDEAELRYCVEELGPALPIGVGVITHVQSRIATLAAEVAGGYATPAKSYAPPGSGMLEELQGRVAKRIAQGYRRDELLDQAAKLATDDDVRDLLKALLDADDDGLPHHVVEWYAALPEEVKDGCWHVATQLIRQATKYLEPSSMDEEDA